MKTQIRTSSGIMILAASLFLASCSDDKIEIIQAEPVAVQVGSATKRSSEKISISGQVESMETAVISTRVMGFISSIKVKPGDKVLKGQLLVTINNDDIMAKRAQAQAMITETEAALKDAQKDYERFEELYKQHSASTKEYENATLRYNSVKAKAEAAEQLKNEANAMLAYTNLVAPFSGIITQKYNDEGSMANPGMPILTIEQPEGHHVTAFVTENEIGRLKDGMSAEVIIKSTGKKLTGKITEISPSSQFTGGQFKIKVAVPSTENAGLFSGMHCNVNILLKNISGPQNLFVPASAVIRKDQLIGLYTIGEGQTAQLRWLKAGKESDEEIEILSGLNPEETFIMHSDGRLYSGVPVIVK